MTHTIHKIPKSGTRLRFQLGLLVLIFIILILAGWPTWILLTIFSFISNCTWYSTAQKRMKAFLEQNFNKSRHLNSKCGDIKTKLCCLWIICFRNRGQIQLSHLELANILKNKCWHIYNGSFYSLLLLQSPFRSVLPPLREISKQQAM